MGIAKIAGSSKASMVLLIFLALAVLVALGKLESEYLKTFLGIVMPTWLVAHAGEQGAKAIAAGPVMRDSAEKAA